MSIGLSIPRWILTRKRKKNVQPVWAYKKTGYFMHTCHSWPISSYILGLKIVTNLKLVDLFECSTAFDSVGEKATVIATN